MWTALFIQPLSSSAMWCTDIVPQAEEDSYMVVSSQPLSWEMLTNSYLTAKYGPRGIHFARTLVDPDIYMNQVPYFAEEIRQALDNGYSRPESAATASRLGEILLRDFGMTENHKREDALALSRQLEILGYRGQWIPGLLELPWPFRLSGVQESLLEVDFDGGIPYLYQRKGQSQFAFLQIEWLLELLRYPALYVEMGLSRFEARSLRSYLQTDQGLLRINIERIRAQIPR